MEDETADEALDRQTLQVLREISAGTRNVIPMASIMVTLRQENDWNVLESAVVATVERIDDLRGSVQETPTQPAAVQPGVPPVVDSVQN